jgi:glutaconate CoA-transferase subunit B
MTPHEVATLMTCRLAREVRDGDVVGVGLGTPLALAAALLARRVHAPGAHVIVAGAVSPDADLATCMRGAAALDGRAAGYAVHLVTMEMAERGAMTMQFLRPAQIDGAGNANTSRIVAGGELVQRLPGGLATADVFRVLPRIVLYHTDHRPRSLPDRVSFLTAAAPSRPTTLVTDRAVLVVGGGEPARLESVHPGEDEDYVRAETGFALAPGSAPATEPPTDAELEALADIDPDALRELELRATHAAAAERLAAAHH